MVKKVRRSFRGFGELDEGTREGNVALGKDGALRLIRWVLLADERGCCTNRDMERIGGRVVARKDFWIGNLKASSAKLFAYLLCGRSGAVLTVEVNGHPLTHRWREERPYWKDAWTTIEVPVEYLREGLNTFVFRGDEGDGWRLLVEPSVHPDRSAKSVDGGRTGDYDHLGENGSNDGEYLVRLGLEMYPEEGAWTSPVVDVPGLSGDGRIRPKARTRFLSFGWEGEAPDGTEVVLLWRGGGTPSYRPDSWSPWEEVGGPVEAEYPFVQARALLRSDGSATPEIREVWVEGEVEVEGEAKVRVASWDVPKIVRSSYPFSYLSYEEPRAAILRERYGLEKVVEGAGSEWEALVRLRDWARRQWEDGWDPGTIRFCPPWDALVILELASRKLTLGMCTHYATVFVHACASLGFPARIQIMRSHCIAEVWSNDHGKWVAMDVGRDSDDSTKYTYHFERNGVPLSALEVHRAWVNRDLEGIRMVPEAVESKFRLEDRLRLFERFCIHLRNDQLTSLGRDEPEHGFGSYHYDGYLWWEDEPGERLPWFSLWSSREGDFHWTLYQTEVYLGTTEEDTVLRVLLDTETPNFWKYEARRDGGGWEEVPEEFMWRLHPGENILEVRVLDRFGRAGRTSRVVVEV